MSSDLKGEEQCWISMGIVGHHPAELVSLAHKSEAVPGVVVSL